MIKRVLVGLRRYDRIEDALPLLEDTVTPGTKVMFLIPYPVEPWSYLPKYCDDPETGRAATFVTRKYASQFVWETQRQLAESRLYNVRQALCSKNVEIEFKLYGGSLTSAIRDCANHSEFDWIVTWKSHWLGFSVPKAGLFRRQPSAGLYLQRFRYARS